MKTTRMLRGAGAAVLTLTLTACLKMDMDLEINTDDTIDGSVIMAFSQDFMDMAGDMGEGAGTEDMFDDFLNMETEGEDVPEYATVEPYDDGEYVGQEVILDGAPLDELNQGDQMTGLSITREGEEFVVEGEMNMADTGASEMGEIPPGMLETMEFDMQVSITFPGEVLEHNGSLDGTTVTWEPQIGEANEMSARSLDSGGGGGVPAWLWILIGLVVVAALVVLLYVLSRSRGSSAQPVTDDGSVAPVANRDDVAPVADGGNVPPPAAPGVVPPPPPAAPGSDVSERPASPGEPR